MSQRITPEIVLQGYCIGAFPMGNERGEIHWYDPDPRCIFELDRLKISRSLRQVLRRGEFETRVNTAFAEVMAHCAQRPEGTWISDEIHRVYTALHRAGYAHSVEAWQGDSLVGGLYGVSIGAAFFGESMFHRVGNASKVALVALVERMRERGLTLLDSQWRTPHLASLGAIEIPREEYLRRLDAAIRTPRAFDEFTTSAEVPS